MNHASLYSGIGGWLLAAQWAGIDNIFTCEIDKFCNKILDKHFPNTDRHYDIKETDFTKYAGSVDILSTSDPCQPFSFAGKRGGKADDRYLWPQTIRVIREIKPAYVLFENVPGFISLGFETVASGLEGEGYTVESFVIPACAVGAWHRRDRLWIVARNTESNGGNGKHGDNTEKERENGICTTEFNGSCKDAANSTKQGLQNGRGASMGDTRKEKPEPERQNSNGGEWWATEPDVGRVAHGIPNRVDRLKALGNSIVPQIAYILFEAIKHHENIIS